MALFKPFRGNRAALDNVELHDGYAYFCIDDATFHIDVLDSDGVVRRKQINAKDAATLAGMSYDDIKAYVEAMTSNTLANAKSYTNDKFNELSDLIGNEIITDEEIDAICATTTANVYDGTITIS